MYALYKNVSLSTSFSGDDGFKNETQVVFNFHIDFYWHLLKMLQYSLA